MTVKNNFPDDLVIGLLENILMSPEFASSPQISTVLRYIVKEALEGRADRIKAYTIAIDALNKNESFDPSTNPLVRVLVGRLRVSLNAYYESKEGLEQVIFIAVPKGGYVPFFTAVKNRASSTERPQGKARAALSFSRTIVVEQFDVITSDSISETATSRSMLVGVGFQIELVDKLSRFKDFIVLDAPPVDDVVSSYSVGQYLLTGKIRLSNSRMIIAPVLQRRNDNAILWSRTYDKVFENTDALFDVQAEIAADVAATLGQPYGTIVARTAAVRSKLKEMDLDHYLALVDFYQYSNDKTDKKFDEVLAGLKKATREVPEFSSAWAALSWMYSFERLHVNKDIDRKEFSAKALAAAHKAVNADPQNAMAYQYLAIARFNDGDGEGFKKAARTALELNPNDAEVLADMGSHFIQLENSDEGKEMVERAMQLSPGHPPWYHLAITIYHYMRHHSDQAIYHARQYAQEGSLSSYMLLAASLVQGSRLSEAKDSYQKLLERRPVFKTDYQRILDNWPLPDGMTEMLFEDLVMAGLVPIAK